MDGSPSTSHAAPDISATLHATVVNLMGYAQARLRLLQCEWSIERLRLGNLLATTIYKVLLLFFTLQMAALLIIAAFWDTPWRLEAIGAVLAASVIATVVASRLHEIRKAEPSTLFNASIREFDKDRAPLLATGRMRPSP